MRLVRTHRLDTAVEALTLALLVYLPIAFAGVNMVWRAPGMLAAALLIALVATNNRHYEKRHEKSALGDLVTARKALKLFGAFLLVILFQLTPVPRFLAEYFCVPGIALEGAMVPSHPVPARGTVAALTWLIPFAVFFAIVSTYRSQAQIRRLARVIVGVACFEAVYGLVEWVSGHQHIFLVPKRAYVDVATGTFVNRNHFAGYLEMAVGLLVGIGLFHYTHKRVKEGTLAGRGERLVLVAFGAMLALGAMAASGSRAAPLCLVTALLIAGLLVFHGGQRKGFFIAVAAVALLGIAFSFWIGADPLIQRYGEVAENARAGDARPRVFWGTFKMWLAAPVLGTGAGAFGDVFPLFRPESVLAYYDHAHNDYLEILAETGMAGFAAISSGVVLLMISAYRAGRRRTSRFARCYALGAMIGVISLSLHGLVDFNLTIPANQATFFALLGLATVASGRRLYR
ncbi:MAG: O-antigen ligase family protein [Deltaproteobacteria bacterium]|nr:O-antigen ligase family protein [Deltaproteobacteria bacterium]